ncbi:EGF-like domain protein [Dictyocaulus viviparus]|uniref:EGF-like domain protein n=1 Tax=Dictyocaulus viviparus TaxID=29172 RepID=A0A0D8XMA9_DICVI|nr:EGF-like domain protein [Dictyocaulus viviparus]
MIVLLVYGAEKSLADDLVENPLCDLNTGSPCSAEDHEECRFQNGSNEIGVCMCKSGFAREFQGAPCLPENVIPTTFILSKVVNNTSVEAMKNSLNFTVEGPSIVRLPTNSVNASIVFSTGIIPHEDSYSFLWELLQGTGLAVAPSYKRPVLELSQLRPGKLLFHVTMSNATHSGSQQYGLLVEPPITPNKPPKAVIRPESPVRGVEGTRLTLDAEGSIDDGKIISYKWTQDEGPSVPIQAMNTPILTLDNMVAGNYMFSVVVTDNEGLTASTSARVVIEAERDDPPKAHINECGSKEHSGSITVRLPLSELSLCGNGSTDDKGIVSYNWFRVDKLSEKLSVDTAGSTTNVLTLRNIQANERFGPYEFQLDVKDTKGQKDSAHISVFVNKPQNLPPELRFFQSLRKYFFFKVADAGGNHTVILPESAIVLVGNAKDDGSIVGYEWRQIDGPSKSVLLNADKAKATASALEEGVYHFVLTVVDDGGKNEPPTARAHNVTVQLPTSIAILNATSSSDDAGIVVFHWQQLDDVPASMIPLDGSENRAVMFVTGLVEGSHFYNLTVIDQQKASNSILVTLTVTRGVEEVESVEILMKKNIGEWTYRQSRKLKDRIEASLAGSIEECDSVVVQFTRFETLAHDGRLWAVFYAKSFSRQGQSNSEKQPHVLDSGLVVNADRIVSILRDEKSMLSDFQISIIQPLYCKLDCSGHGKCDDVTKQCECDDFWMGNIFAYLSSGFVKEDCAWSSIYFFMISISLVVICAFFLMTKRRSIWHRVNKRRFRRRKRYVALRSQVDDVEKETYRLRNGPRLEPTPTLDSSESLGSESDDLIHVSKNILSQQQRENL